MDEFFEFVDEEGGIWQAVMHGFDVDEFALPEWMKADLRDIQQQVKETSGLWGNLSMYWESTATEMDCV